jgi:hypothetical protein
MQISYTQEAVAVTLKERAGQLKTDIPAVMLCLRRRETPLAAKLLAASPSGAFSRRSSASCF